MTALTDADARHAISHDTDRTLFVNAGAGSGKTTALVNRVATLVLTDGVRLANIAAVTFTEKAGAELRDRLRARFEKVYRERGPDTEAAAEALDDLDSAAIGTLHAFAQRVLGEYPIQAGLPPIVEVLDEVGSSVAFDARWTVIQAQMLDDDEVAGPLLTALALGASLTSLRSLTQLLSNDWDLIEARILANPPPPATSISTAGWVSEARRVLALRDHCTSDDDRLLPSFAGLEILIEQVESATDDDAKLQALSHIASLKFSNGQKANWIVPVAEVRESGKQLVLDAGAIVAVALDQVLRRLVPWLASQVLDAAQARRTEGKLEFHDLLVLARNLLRTDAGVRQSLSQTYQRLLLDEFQDTDPIQIELATRICGGAGAVEENWRDITVPPGRLFVVGDAKQSIYRFRRANIRTYLEAEGSIGDAATLTTNFRSVQPILDWVNGVFAQLIVPQPEGQPDYVPLDGHRTSTATGAAVTVLGAEPHAELPTSAAGILREREADDVAGIIATALTEQWQVWDERANELRTIRPDDIAVLVPARTSLPYLEDALDGAAIPYRAEASSLVYQSSEVRNLLACARAIADPTDAFALVTVLRSPLFGCGDDDLWRWKHDDHGSFSILVRDLPDSANPVRGALTYLCGLADESRWLSPSEILGRIVADRRMFEVAATRPRARDGWRRLRFVVDQARAWTEVSHGGLRAYLEWADRQGQELSRVTEAVLPETDANSVRVMTIHAAKGLEFPMVVLTGMTAQRRAMSGVALLWTDTGCEVRLRRTIQTGDFDVMVPIDEQMDELEKRRLLYVGATRARDHLVVSLHRKDGATAGTAAKLMADASGSGFGAEPFTAVGTDALAGVAAPAVPSPPPFDDWLVGVVAARAASLVASSISASGLEGTEPAIVLDSARQDGLAKGVRDLDLPPWSKGRYGSAIGRAVHGVLQVVDLVTHEGVESSVAAQCAAEGLIGQEKLVADLARSALSSDLVTRAAARPHWRESYVATVQDDGTILEGYIDLVYRQDDGRLVVVDYKTDAIGDGALAARVQYYKPQMDAYVTALSAATGETPTATLLFLNPTTSVAVPVD